MNRFFYPDHSATSQLLSDLAFGLAAQGRVVSVITSRQRYDGVGKPLTRRETIAGVDVHRVWASRFGRRGVLGRSIDYLTFYVSATWRLWQLARRGDVIISKTDPPMLSVFAVPIARMSGARAVNWLQDLFPEVAELLGFAGRTGKLGFRLLRPLRNRSLEAADTNVVLGEQMAERLTRLGVPRERIVIIPNWADGQIITPIARSANAVRHHLGLGDRFVVGYSGNLGRAHDSATILDAIMRVELTRARPGIFPSTPPAISPIAWLFIGGGSQFETLRRRAALDGHTSVRFEPYQPRELLAESLSAVDLHLVSLRPVLEGAIVPSKFYGIAAAGRPTIFIGDRDGEVARTIARIGCGISVAEGDGAALAEAIVTLAGDPRRCAAMGAAARAAFEAEFDKPIAIGRWQELIGSLGQRGGRGRDALV